MSNQRSTRRSVHHQQQHAAARNRGTIHTFTSSYRAQPMPGKPLDMQSRWRLSVTEHTEPGALYAVLMLLRWHTLPAGKCAHCKRQTITPRTLVVSFGGIPSRDVRPGDIADETYADGRFCRMAREQAEGTYNVGGMVAVCPACAATLLRPLPDNLGMIVGFTRQVFPTRMTDIVLGHGKPGPEEPAGSIIVGADAGELIPDLENHLAQLARQHLATTPKRIFSWEVLP